MCSISRTRLSLPGFSGKAARQARRSWSFGSGTSKYMYITPKGSSGLAEFVINNGVESQMLNAEFALPVGKWTHVAVTFISGDVLLYINGKETARNLSPIMPDSVMGPNTVNGGTYAYIGRGAKGDFFNGMIDDFRVYSLPQSDSLIAELGKAPKIVPMGKGVHMTVYGPGIAKAGFKMKPTAISDTRRDHDRRSDQGLERLRGILLQMHLRRRARQRLDIRQQVLRLLAQAGDEVRLYGQAQRRESYGDEGISTGDRHHSQSTKTPPGGPCPNGNQHPRASATQRLRWSRLKPPTSMHPSSTSSFAMTVRAAAGSPAGLGSTAA